MGCCVLIISGMIPAARRAARAGATPSGGDAQRLLMAASTPGQHLPGVRPSKALSSFIALSVRFGLSPIPPKPLRGLGDEAGDPLGSQEQQHIHRPILRNSSSARPPRAADASLRPRTAIPQGIALLAFSLKHSQQVQPKARPNSPPRVSPCGSAVAPPRFRAPGEILSKRTSAF